MKPGLQVLLADDHAVVRRGLKQILAEEFRGAVFGEAESAQQVLDLVRRQRWDLLLLDVTMPGRSGLDVLQQVRKEHPKLPVLVLSVHPEEQFGLRVLRAGASGYIQKETAPEHLVSAVRRVLRGERILSPALADKLLFESKEHGALHERLSDREFQILRLLGAGRSVGEIAAQFHLSAKTVSTYRTRILEKTGFRSNAELIRYCLEAGLQS